MVFAVWVWVGGTSECDIIAQSSIGVEELTITSHVELKVGIGLTCAGFRDNLGNEITDLADKRGISDETPGVTSLVITCSEGRTTPNVALNDTCNLYQISPAGPNSVTGDTYN